MNLAFVLFNLNEQAAATGQIQIRDDFGDNLSVDLDGEVVNGLGDLSVPAGGLLVLRTDGEGDLETGSVQITTDLHVDPHSPYGARHLLPLIYITIYK